MAKKSDLKTRGKSKKSQGEPAGSASASDTKQMPMPQRLGRGMGSAFANALHNLTAEGVKGSKHGFMGVEKQTLDPAEYATGSKKKKK